MCHLPRGLVNLMQFSKLQQFNLCKTSLQSSFKHFLYMRLITHLLQSLIFYHIREVIILSHYFFVRLLRYIEFLKAKISYKITPSQAYYCLRVNLHIVDKRLYLGLYRLFCLLLNLRQEYSPIGYLSIHLSNFHRKIVVYS